MSNNQLPGWPQQPNNQQPPQPENGAAHTPIPPAPGHGGQPQFPPYGEPGHLYGQTSMFTQAPPKTGMPVWGWVACGVGGLAIIAVGGVVVFNGLTGGGKDLVAAPDAKASKSAVPDESAKATAAGEPAAAVYLFDETDFTSAPVWAVKTPEGWTMESVNEDAVNYSNSNLQCTFTTHQAVLPPTGETEDEAATALVMASEIDAVKQSVGKPVEVVTDAASTYVNLRNGKNEIELQEAELRFRNAKDADVIYRMALRATPGSDGLMELGLACPASLSTESTLWSDLTDRVAMVDAP